ncbi:nucleotide exchange factor GrpE [Candidatus Marinamargulisbacteria bacterium SCGC AG-410-N11]|nr:nucleotide exchange factor GrpE [Candidatus Marinamargulisbacteria bacterium SCGC AG-410-N11]
MQKDTVNDSLNIVEEDIESVDNHLETGADFESQTKDSEFESSDSENTEDEQLKDDSSTDENDESQQVILDYENKVKDLNEQLKLEREKALRSLAELENFKKRKQIEVDNFKKYSIENVVVELLPILDSFELACNHATNDKDETIKNDEKSIIEGFVLIKQQIVNTLEKMNVKRLDCINQVFDPNFHQAVAEEESEGVDSGVVLKEMQAGYVLHDRVIRPSMVVVSK